MQLKDLELRLKTASLRAAFRKIKTRVANFSDFKSLTSFVLSSYLLIATISGCSLTPSLEAFELVEPGIEINGFLQDGKPLRVEINKVSSQLFGEIDDALPEARVTLFEDDIPIQELIMDSSSIAQNPELIFSFSPFVTLEPVWLKPGSTYYVEAESEGLSLARSSRQRYEPVLRIDSIVDPLQVRNGEPGRYAETVTFTAIGEILRSAPGNLEVSVLTVDSTDDAFFRNLQRDFLSVSTGFQPGIINPINGQFLPEFKYTNPGGASRIEADDRYVIYTFQFTPEQYLSVTKAILAQSNGGEDFNAEGAVLGPIPSNAESGYGFFTIIEEHVLRYEL